jgi:DNA polymerase-3 subunit delta'
MVGSLRHPDLHWFFPLPSPKGSHTPKKRRELLEEARAEALDARRADPFAVGTSDTSAAIYLAMVEDIRSRATRRPAMGSSSVFLIGDAERMVPQASSQEAANAFLKLLEEPPPDTVIILTSSRPGSLLPTIRSRSLAVRVTAPDPAEAEAFLVQQAGMESAVARTLARRSQGAVGLALRMAEADPAQVEEGWDFVRTALTGSAADRFAGAAKFPVSGARGPFSATLDRIEEVLRECVTNRVDCGDFAWHSDVETRLPGILGVGPDRLLAALDCVEQARMAAAGNGNPQGIAGVLLSDLARELRPGAPTARNVGAGHG